MVFLLSCCNSSFHAEFKIRLFFFLVSLYAYLNKTGGLVLGGWFIFFGDGGEVVLFCFK